MYWVRQKLDGPFVCAFKKSDGRHVIMAKVRVLRVLLLFGLSPAWIAHAADDQLDRGKHVAASIAPMTAKTLPNPDVRISVPAESYTTSQSPTVVCLSGTFVACKAMSPGMQVAFCDIDSTGFSECLSRNARALVNHQAEARQAFNVALQLRDGGTAAATVLMPAGASQNDAVQLANH
jgi:hypothetical protein